MIMRQEFRILVAAVIVSAVCTVGWSQPILDDAKPADDKGLDYSGWTSITKEPIRIPENVFTLCRPSPLVETKGPHFVPAIKVYANAEAAKHLKSKATGAMPEKTVIVKEKWWNEKDKSPNGYAAMIKREKGYDPQNGDWEYLFADLKGAKKIQRGKLESCIECHKRAKDTDYLFKTYIKFDEAKEKK